MGISLIGIGRRLFSVRRYAVYEKIVCGLPAEDSVAVGSEFRTVNISTDEQLKEFLRQYQLLDEFRGVLEQTDSLEDHQNIFAVIRGDQAVHVSWYCTKNTAAKKDSLFTRFDFGDAVYIGPCVTPSPFRGHNLYPFALSAINVAAHRMGFTRTVINTRRNNQSSVRGIEKAGFSKLVHLKAVKLLFWHTVGLE